MSEPWRGAVLALALAGLAAGCARDPLLVERSPCPAAAIPFHTGSYTRFDPPESRDADAIDFVAQIVDLRSQCVPGDRTIVSDVVFTVAAARRRAGPAREEVVPLFITLVQGGNVLMAKQLTAVRLSFAEGALRAEAQGRARAEVARAAAAIPPEIERRITRARSPREEDALVDPLADPQVRAALRAASFEVLVGFQLDDASLAFNVAR